MSSPAESRADGRSERQEAKLLADHLRRLERSKFTPAAVHVQIRERFISGRQDALIRLALRPVRDLAHDRGAPYFALSPRECVVICDNIDPAHVIAASRLPEPDPLLPTMTIRPLIRCYDLAETDDRLALMALARAHADSAPGASRDAAAEPETSPLDARVLATIHTRLKQFRIADLVRHQTAVTVTGVGCFEPLFQELFVSIAELQRLLAPRTDMFGRPALFRYLTEVLDGHVLKALAEGSFNGEYPLSLNLNVRSICSPAFRTMLAARDRTLPLYIEVQVSDMLAFPAVFQEAAKIAREGRCHFGIDGVTPLMLSFLDIGTIAADFVKIAWLDAEASAGPPQRREEFAMRLEHIGVSRIIFTRIEAIDALQSAIAFGVKRLQGHLVDRLVRATASNGAN